jgi:hypothetical protein
MAISLPTSETLHNMTVGTAFEAKASMQIYMVRPYSVKKIRVQFSIGFNLV